MVDVIFLLIVFFLAAARLEQDRREPVDLPQQAGEMEQKRREGLVLTLLADGTLRIAGVSRDIEALPALLAEASTGRNAIGDPPPTVKWMLLLSIGSYACWLEVVCPVWRWRLPREVAREPQSASP